MFLGLCFFFVKRLTEQPGPVPNLSQAAKAELPEKAAGSTLKSQVSESESSDSSDSEEESPAAQTQASQAGESPGSTQDLSPASLRVPAHGTAAPALDDHREQLSHSDNLLSFACSENQCCGPANKCEEDTGSGTNASPSPCGQQR